MTSTILAYISGHGYGHAARTAPVLAALTRRLGARIVLRSAAPEFLFQDVPHERIAGACDVGLVQRDGLVFDLDATRRACGDRIARWDALVEAELAHVARRGPDLVLADIPPLAFAVADRAGLPSVGLANFGWDWIYGEYTGFDSIAAHAAAQYAKATLLLRLPFHGDLSAFPRIRDIGLVGGPSGQTRKAARAALGLDPGRPAALLSFGRHGVELDLSRLRRTYPDVEFLLPEGRDHRQLLVASNVVLTKPGFGITSDLVHERRRVLYSDRGAFREYPLLASALETHLGGRHLPQARLRAGHLSPELERMIEDGDPPPAEIPGGGTEQAVEAIAALG